MQRLSNCTCLYIVVVVVIVIVAVVAIKQDLHCIPARFACSDGGGTKFDIVAHCDQRAASNANAQMRFMTSHEIYTHGMASAPPLWAMFVPPDTPHLDTHNSQKPRQDLWPLHPRPRHPSSGLSVSWPISAPGSGFWVLGHGHIT